MNKPIYICGPTASGKSSIAIELALAIDGEIVNGDAYQIYKGIEVLSAAPDQAELEQVPHHLFSILDPSEVMDAQRFLEITRPCIDQIQQRGKTPIIVGGSGMYLKFLTHGPSPVPSGDEALRQTLEQCTDQQLVEEFTNLDPEGAAITNLQNRRYVIRALEICLLSGEKMSVLKSDWASKSQQIENNLRGCVLAWEPEPLRKRIHTRTWNILKEGAIDEVRQLTTPSITSEKAIGVSTIREYLAGNITLERCHELIYFATSQYAKRQRTWFKKENWLHQIPVTESSTKNDILKLALQNTN